MIPEPIRGRQPLVTSQQRLEDDVDSFPKQLNEEAKSSLENCPYHPRLALMSVRASPVSYCGGSSCGFESAAMPAGRWLRPGRPASPMSSRAFSANASSRRTTSGWAPATFVVSPKSD